MPIHIDTQTRECYCPKCGYRLYLTTHFNTTFNNAKYYLVHRYDTTEQVSICPECKTAVNVHTVTLKRRDTNVVEARTQCLCGTCDAVLWASIDYYDDHTHYWFYADNTSQTELKHCPHCTNTLKGAFVSFDIPDTTAVIPRELLPALSTEVD